MDVEKAKHKLARLCSTKEICEFDAQRKLDNWEIDYQEARKTINWLIDNNFINNKRYAEFYVRDKFRFNKWGKIKINYALRNKNIKENLIENAMNEINKDEYYNTLLHLLKKKLELSKEEEPYILKAKLKNFAYNKGFESHLAAEAIDEIIEQTL